MRHREPHGLTVHNRLRSKRGLALWELAHLLSSLRMEPVGRVKLVEEIRRLLVERLPNFNGDVTDRTLWSYIRHHLTNYEEILAAIKRKVGESELYENFKVYLCCRIVKEYGLRVDPLYAAFGEAGSYGEIPERFIVDDLEATATQLILEEFLGCGVKAGTIGHPDAETISSLWPKSMDRSSQRLNPTARART